MTDSKRTIQMRGEHFPLSPVHFAWIVGVLSSDAEEKARLTSSTYLIWVGLMEGWVHVITGLCRRSTNLTAKTSWEAQNLPCYDLTVSQPCLQRQPRMWWRHKGATVGATVGAVNYTTFSWTAERLIISWQQEPWEHSLMVPAGI